MSNNYFDTLSSDVKIHLFSFLSAKDLVAISSVNRINQKIKQNMNQTFVWERLHREFGIKVMQGVDPVLLHGRLFNERSTLIAYLRAVDCLSQASTANRGLSRDSRQERRLKLVAMLDSLDDSLKTLSNNEFIVVAAAINAECLELYGAADHRGHFARMHAQLVMTDETPLEMVHKMFGNQLFRAPEALDREKIAIQRMMLYLSRCGASTSMELFFNKLPELWQRKIWKTYGAGWSRDATNFHRCATQRKLTELYRLVNREYIDDGCVRRLIKE